MNRVEKDKIKETSVTTSGGNYKKTILINILR